MAPNSFVGYGLMGSDLTLDRLSVCIKFALEKQARSIEVRVNANRCIC